MAFYFFVCKYKKTRGNRKLLLKCLLRKLICYHLELLADHSSLCGMPALVVTTDNNVLDYNYSVLYLAQRDDIPFRGNFLERYLKTSTSLYAYLLKKKVIKIRIYLDHTLHLPMAQWGRTTEH